MLFSIIVPMYNSGNYINLCIESVLNQTESDFEIIIIDDGSKDNSGKIADYYASIDSRIKVIHQNNKGSFHTRINGVDNAHGEYIVFLDADDTLKQNALERLKDHILKDSPDIIIYRADNIKDKQVKSQSEKIFKNGRIFEGNQKKVLYNKIIEDSSLNNLWLKAIKLTCFNNNKVRSYNSISMGDDVLYFLEPLTNAKKIKYIDEVLYNYHIFNTSMTRKFQSNVYKGFKMLTEVKKEYLRTWDIQEENSIKKVHKRLLKNISGIILYSQANIKDRENKYLDVLDEIQSDPLFHEALNYSFDQLSFIHKVPVILLKKKRVKLLLHLKPIVTKLHTLK